MLVLLLRSSPAVWLVQIFTERSAILIQYTLRQIHQISPHRPLTVCSVCADRATQHYSSQSEPEGDLRPLPRPLLATLPLPHSCPRGTELFVWLLSSNINNLSPESLTASLKPTYEYFDWIAIWDHDGIFYCPASWLQKELIQTEDKCFTHLFLILCINRDVSRCNSNKHKNNCYLIFFYFANVVEDWL